MFAPLRDNIYEVRKVSSVDQAVIVLVEVVSTWGVPGLEVDSFVHEIRTFDRHLPACGRTVVQCPSFSRGFFLKYY
jgi:hypothetical protein